MAAAHGKNGNANLAKTRLLIGNLLWLQGDLQGAWSRYQEAVNWLEPMADANPENPLILEELEEAYRRCGDLQGNPSYFHFGDVEKAGFYQKKALHLAEQLAARDPKNAMARASLSVALRRMGACSDHPSPIRRLNSTGKLWKCSRYSLTPVPKI